MKERVLLRKLKSHIDSKKLPDYVKFSVLYLESEGSDRLCYADIISFNCPYCDESFNPESHEDCLGVFETILKKLEEGEDLYESRCP